MDRPNFQVTTDDLLLVIGEKEIDLFSKRKEINYLNKLIKIPENKSNNQDQYNDLLATNLKLKNNLDNMSVENQKLIDTNQELEEEHQNKLSEVQKQHNIVVESLKKKIYTLRKQVETPQDIDIVESSIPG